MKMYILLLIFIFTPHGISLSCHKCFSLSSTTCDTSLEVDSCSSQQKNCYWLKYMDSRDDGQDVGFIKGCTDKQTDCKSLCDWYFNDGYKECQVKCCDGNLCNKETFVETFDRKMTKRASTEYSGNGLKLSCTKKILLLTLLFGLLFRRWCD